MSIAGRNGEVREGHQAGETDARASRIERLQTLFILGLQAIIAVEIVLLIIAGHFLSAFMAGGVLMLPVLFRKISLRVPIEIQLVVIIFSFATLFLGEVQDYYERYWWWDQVIHFSSGLLLGLFGFMVVYIMNENRAVDLHMRKGFLALFAFLFAMAIGGIWEIFEFWVDQAFGTLMQKPRPGDPSGLTDTMWDLTVDMAGALIISFVGWRYMKRAPKGRLRRFIDRNPQLFGER